MPLSTASGQKSVQKPQTTIRLNILEPTALLIASPLLPAIDALMLTEHSGKLVPIATIVIPIISDNP